VSDAGEEDEEAEAESDDDEDDEEAEGEAEGSLPPYPFSHILCCFYELFPPEFDLLTEFMQAPQQPRSRKPPQPLMKPRLPRAAPMVTKMAREGKKKKKKKRKKKLLVMMMMKRRRKLQKMRLMQRRLLPIRPRPVVLLRPPRRLRVMMSLRSRISLRSMRRRQSKLVASLTLNGLEFKSNEYSFSGWIGSTTYIHIDQRSLDSIQTSIEVILYFRFSGIYLGSYFVF